jgi:hypothetical protein
VCAEAGCEQRQGVSRGRVCAEAGEPALHMCLTAFIMPAAAARLPAFECPASDLTLCSLLVMPLKIGPNKDHICSLLSALCSLLSALCSLLSARCSLLSARCSLLSALCSLLSAVCSLLSALCSSFSALCSLLSALCSLLSALSSLMSLLLSDH